MSPILYGVDEDLYINPDHIESITIRETIVIKCASGTIYTFPNDLSHIQQLKRCDILPQEA